MYKRPNILWVTIESLRADHTPMYGYHRDTTPFIRSECDRPDATVFSTPISQSMWTPASTASIFTGTYLSTHQVGQDGKAKRKLRSDLQTLPELLADSGYETALFTPNPYISSATGLDRGFDTVEDLVTTKRDFLPWKSQSVDNWACALQCLSESGRISLAGMKNDLAHNSTRLVPRRFRRWIGNTCNLDRPFFVYAHLNAPHHPYLPPSRFKDRFADDLSRDTDAVYSLVNSVYENSDTLKRRMARGLDLNDAELDAIRSMYDAEIAFADAVARELVESARDRSTRDLLVVITGDHGDLFGEYGLIGHNLVLHDGLIKVPLIMSGVDDAVDTAETITQHIDITRTLASITDTRTEQFEGRDVRDPDRLFGISQRGLASIEEYTKYDEEFEIAPFGKAPLTAIRTAQYKYLEDGTDGVLYELPNETTDVSDARPEILDRLRTVCERMGIQWDLNADQASAEFDSAAQRRLRDLGYLT